MDCKNNKLMLPSDDDDDEIILPDNLIIPSDDENLITSTDKEIVNIVLSFPELLSQSNYIKIRYNDIINNALYNLTILNNKFFLNTITTS